MEPYERTAEAYDLIQASRGHSYERDAEWLTELARERCPNADSLLDVACGTGLHLVAFRDIFAEVAGIDISDGMLERAAARLPAVDLRRGDMRAFSFDREFDVVTCMFSAIGSMLSIADLRSAVGTMARHLSPGGVLIIEPWIHPDGWKVPHISAESAKDEHIAVARASRNGVRGNVSTFTLHWTIVSADSADYIVEDYELGLFTTEEYLDALRVAGLVPERLDGGPLGRGLFIVPKPTL
jgi:ubiquinone/menaquinone biosynthesis C-methylase UbiE